MPIFEAPNGKRMELTFPKVEWEPLAGLVAEYERRTKERRAASRAVGVKEREKEQAIRKDLEAAKKAILEGKDDPGSPHEDKAAKEQKAIRRRFDALELAIEETEMAILDAVDAHRAEWVVTVDEDLEKARGEYEEAVTALSVARARFARHSALKGWVTRFPDQANFRVGIPGVRTLPGLNGDPYPWTDVVAALLADAEPVPARQEIAYGAAALAPQENEAKLYLTRSGPVVK